MPRVPTYDNFQTQQSAQPGALLNAPSGQTPGGVAAEQAGQFGQAMTAASRVMQAEQDKADDFRVSDAINKTLARRIDLTHNKDTGYTTRQGEAALKPDPDGKSLADNYGQQLTDTIDTLSNELGNDRQRRAYRLRAEQMLAQFKGEVQTHMGRENQQYQISVINGGVELHKDAAGAAWSNKAEVGKHLEGIAALMAKNPTGMSPEELKAKTQAQQSAVSLSVVSNAVQANELAYARDYFRDNKDRMTERDREAVTKVLQIGTEREKAQAFGDEMTGKGLGMADALTEARKRFTGGEEDAAVREVKDRYAEIEVARARDTRQVGAAAWSAVMAGGKIPADMLADLRTKAPEEERQIRDWLDAKWRRAKADAEGKVTTDMEKYYGLRLMAAKDPAAFVELDLRKSLPWLSHADFKHLTEIHASISKGDAKAMENQRMVKNTIGMIRAEVAVAGIDLTPDEKHPTKAKETAQFLGALTMALDEAAKAKGSPLTVDESKRIGMGMVREGVEQGSGIFGVFQTKKKGYQIATDPDIKPGASFVAKRYDDIPVALRDKLAQEVRERYKLGTRPLTTAQKDEVERMYTTGNSQGRF